MQDWLVVDEDAPISMWMPKPGDRFERYEVTGEIARGGMAAVYSVRRTSIGGFGKNLAMKVLLPHLRDERQFVQMFLDEARLASAIHHPNVVQIFDLGELRGVPFLVMERVNGCSLAQLLSRARKVSLYMPTGLALHILAEVAQGLHSAHETLDEEGKPMNIVHRDVTPHNIMVSVDGSVQLTDFGIAAGSGRVSSTRSGELRGKLSYISPEQIERLHALDRRVDIWSLGVVGWELLSGRRLFKAGDEAAILWEIVSGDVPEVNAAGLPREALEMLNACLQRDRERRPETSRAVAEVFARAAQSLECRGRMDVEAFIREVEARETGAAKPAAPESSTQLAAPSWERETSRESTSPTEEATSTGTPVSTSTVGRHAPARPRSSPLPYAAAAVLAVGAIVGLWRFREINRPTADERPALAPTAPPTVERKLVAVSPRVRMVLVDGQRHDERPLALDFSSNTSLRVELVLDDGRVLQREVRAGALPERLGPTANPSASAPPASASAAPSQPVRPGGRGPRTSPLMSNPY